jgi:protease I
MTGKQILMIVGDFGEDYEIMVPFQALSMVGHDVDAVCPEREAGETGKTAVHDFRGDQTYLETRGHDFELNATTSDVDPGDDDALVVPGEHAPEYRRTSKYNRSAENCYATVRRSWPPRASSTATG